MAVKPVSLLLGKSRCVLSWLMSHKGSGSDSTTHLFISSRYLQLEHPSLSFSKLQILINTIRKNCNEARNGLLYVAALVILHWRKYINTHTLQGDRMDRWATNSKPWCIQLANAHCVELITPGIADAWISFILSVCEREI